MLSAGFEPAIPAIERLQTSVLDQTVAGISNAGYLLHIATEKKLRGNWTCHTDRDKTRRAYAFSWINL